jgi:hypothetical protein
LQGSRGVITLTLTVPTGEVDHTWTGFITPKAVTWGGAEVDGGGIGEV